MPMTTRYTVVDGEILAQTRNGVRHHYVPDPSGNVIALYDNNQTKTDTFEYWPYGEQRNRTGTTETPFRFGGALGYYRDTDRWTYVRARYYRPDHGRWHTSDPLGLESSELNMYRYAADNPSTLNDPSGQKVCVCWSRKFGVPLHQWISTNKCGAWGFYPKPGKWKDPGIPPGIVAPDNRRMKEPCVPKPVPGTTVGCRELDPRYEALLCDRCIPPSRSKPPKYFGPFQNCITWVEDMLSCARNILEPPGPPYREWFYPTW